MKAFLLVASAVLVALGSISVSVNAQSTGATEAAARATAHGALDEHQPNMDPAYKNVNGLRTTASGE